MPHGRVWIRALVVCSATCLLLLAACSSSPEEPGAEPTPTASSRTASTEPTAPGWEGEYSPDELAAYKAALGRWTEYEARSEPIWARGQATPQARALFKEYFPSPIWQDQFSQLETYEQVKVKVSGMPTILWSRPTRIAVTGVREGSVTIRQCVDFTSVTTTQWGKPVDRAAPFNQPLIRTLVVDQPKGFRWLIYEIRSPSTKKFARCTKDDV